MAKASRYWKTEQNEDAYKKYWVTKAAEPLKIYIHAGTKSLQNIKIPFDSLEKYHSFEHGRKPFSNMQRLILVDF